MITVDRRKWTVAAALGAALLIGCSKPPQSGYVTGHDFKPAHSWTELQPVTVAVGKSVVITSWIPVQRSVPDRWWIRVKDDAEPHREGWVAIDQAGFGRYADGTHWPDER